MRKVALFFTNLSLLLSIMPGMAAEKYDASTTKTTASLTTAQHERLKAHIDSVLSVYTDSLKHMAVHLTRPTKELLLPTPYYYRIFGPAALYNSVLSQYMSIPEMASKDTDTRPSLGSYTDTQVLLSEALNSQLARAYVKTPQLFENTQDKLASVGKIRSDLDKIMQNDDKLSDKVSETVPEVTVEAVEPVPTRPNFWKFKGNGKLQFTQSYFSRNWYQGGENNYSMLSMLTGEANFNNLRRVQWDNKLEAQLGFQTSENNDPKFRPTSNLLRLTSNLSIKAIGHWNYSAQLQFQTQPYMSYQGTSRTVTGDFLSPLYVRSSIGMNYKLDKKNFNGALMLAPLSYVITYVERQGLVTRYGIVEGHHSKHEWGPNIEMKFTWKMVKNVSWQSRLYWFSNFKMTRIENENTFNFTINKYLSAQFFINPRYEDTRYYNVKYDENGNLTDDSARETYWMFKEFLSLGLSYDF